MISKQIASNLTGSLLVAMIAMLGFSYPAFAQIDHEEKQHVDIDTITFGGVHPGLELRYVIQFAHVKLDTMIWGGAEGASIIRYGANFMGLPGEFRLGTEGALVAQVNFSAATKDAADAAKAFERLNGMLIKQYGEPDETYANDYRLTKWHGGLQDLTLKTADGTNYVSLVLELHRGDKRHPGTRIRLKNGR